MSMSLKQLRPDGPIFFLFEAAFKNVCLVLMVKRFLFRVIYVNGFGKKIPGFLKWNQIKLSEVHKISRETQQAFQ